MAYEVIILGHLHMPLYFLGTFTEYPFFCFPCHKTTIFNFILQHQRTNL